MWKIADIKYIPDTGYVKKVVAFYEKTSGSAYARHFANVVFNSEIDDTFIPLDELTNDKVLEWVLNTLSEEQLEEIDATTTEAAQQEEARQTEILPSIKLEK